MSNVARLGTDAALTRSGIDWIHPRTGNVDGKIRNSSACGKPDRTASTMSNHSQFRCLLTVIPPRDNDSLETDAAMIDKRSLAIVAQTGYLWTLILSETAVSDQPSNGFESHSSSAFELYSYLPVEQPRESQYSSRTRLSIVSVGRQWMQYPCLPRTHPQNHF
jgi:hypothetical protein